MLIKSSSWRGDILHFKCEKTVRLLRRVIHIPFRGYNYRHLNHNWDFPGGSAVIFLQCRSYKRHRFDLWVRKIPFRRAWQPTPVFLPGKPHGQGRLVDDSPWGLEEPDTTEHTCPMVIYLNMGPSESLSSVVQSCLTLCDPVDCSTPGFPVHHQLPELAQTHVHWVSDTIQPSHPLSSPSPAALNLSQHPGLFQWVSSLHQVTTVLEFQLQHQSFKWIFRTDFL